MHMLTSYKAVLAVPNDENTEMYTFTDLYFHAGSHMTVPELAETAFENGSHLISGTRIVRISRIDLARYEFHDDFNSYYGMLDENHVGCTDTVLYRDSELDSVYEEYEKRRESDAGSFGPSIPDEEIPF